MVEDDFGSDGLSEPSDGTGGRPPRRRALRGAVGASLGALLAWDIPLAHAGSVMAVRVWPARDYTRVTLELDEQLKHAYQLVTQPNRLVLDLEGASVDAAVRDLVAKIQPDDPYIQQVRVGQFKPSVMRLVFDLKTTVAPQVFTLKPVDQYRYRLVLDLFPATPADPLMELLADAYQRGANQGAAKPGTDPLGWLLADRGSGGAEQHGGDPGGKTGGRGSAGGGMSSGGAAGAGNGSAGDAGAGAGAPGAAGAPASGGGNRRNGPASAGPSPWPVDPDLGGPTAAGADTPSQATIDAALRRATPPGSPVGGAASGDRSRRGGKPAVSRLVTIALDPGHGGEDPGAIGRGGTREKDVVLAIAQRLRDRINSEPNMRAFLTRDSDFFVPLSVRVEKARRVKADLFISIHADAFVRPDARGASVFVLSGRGASSTAARWLANKENRSDLIGGVRLARSSTEVARMLLEMSTSAQIRDSSNVGRFVLTELGGLGRLHKRDIEQAGFAVLKAPDIPSILVETAFISNPQEEAKLSNPGHQASVAEAIFKGVRRYFIKHPPAQRSQAT